MEIYVHIPFCIRKCLYCDFVSFADKSDYIEKYISALCNEIRITAPMYKGCKIDTVYIGGGTPSILSIEQITRLVDTLNNEFDIKGSREKRKGLFLQKKIRPETEFSIECNPGTVSKEKFKCYKKLGINRVSIGLQSVNDDDLKILGRIHNYEDFTNAFEWAREAGFDNINVDLMQAIPGQNLNEWKKNLAVISSWMPEHISAYSLIIEDGTAFSKMYDNGELPLPDEETERKIYYYTKEFLEKAGYYRYEISNYAKNGFECKHNCGYWERADYLGLGLNASSCVNDVRWKNTADFDKYIEFYENPTVAESLTEFREEVEELTHKEKMEEYIMLGLRMTKGISKAEFFRQFGQDFDFTYGDIIKQMVDLGLIDVNGDNIKLTDKGIDVSNTVLAEFLLD